MHEPAELDRRLREWLQPPADVIERVRRHAASAGVPERPRRWVPIVLASFVLVTVAALVVLRWSAPPVQPGVAFTIEASDDMFVVRAEGRVWVLPITFEEDRQRVQTDYFVLDAK
jgi:hypothetical protein